MRQEVHEVHPDFDVLSEKANHLKEELSRICLYQGLW